MDLLARCVWFGYAIVLMVLSLYGLHRYWILYRYFKYYRWTPPLPEPDPSQFVPVVTVQLPFYNEVYVAERSIRAAAALEYPQDKLEIQVLDDSTDETRFLCQKVVTELAQAGFSISCRHRHKRVGFKAGALQEGLMTARGEFIAIFDADFIPQTDFLKRTIPYFQDAGIGMIQTRWGHLNRNYSLLTRLQAMFLDGHFILEHTARNRSQAFFNFNGTAGIWRKQAILDSGGWQDDTLTEDLDLSYRAQLAGWRFLFLPHVVCPAELPVDIIAFKNQQHRWTKGALQTAKKILPLLWRSRFPLSVKIEATVHLTSNVGYLLTVIFSVTMLPSLLLRYRLYGTTLDWLELWTFFFTSATFAIFYTVSQWEAYPDWRKKIGDLPALLSLGIGMCLNNARAIVEVLCNKKSEFRRTPKFAVERKQDHWKDRRYRNRWTWFLVLEAAMCVYFAIVILVALQWSLWGALPYLCLFLFGYSYVVLLSVAHSKGTC